MYIDRGYRGKINELTLKPESEGLETLLYARFLLRMLIIVGVVVRNSKCWTASGIDLWENLSHSSNNREKEARILGFSLHEFKSLTDDERFYIGIYYIIESISNVVESTPSAKSIDDLRMLCAIAMESDTAYEDTAGLSHFVFRLTEQVIKLTRVSIDSNYQKGVLIQNDTCFISSVDGVMNGPFDAYCFEKIHSDIDLVKKEGVSTLRRTPLWDDDDLKSAVVEPCRDKFLTTLRDLELQLEKNKSSVLSNSINDLYSTVEDGKAPTKMISATNYVSAENAEVIKDSLSRDRYVSALTNIIKNKHNNWNICIGLFARWGDGKTGLLSLLSKKLSDNNTGKGKYYIANFNAWTYQGAENVRAAMAHEIVNVLTTIYYPEGNNEKHTKRDFFMISIEKIFGFFVEIIGVGINESYRFWLAIRFALKKSIVKFLVTVIGIVISAPIVYSGLSDFIPSFDEGWRHINLSDVNFIGAVEALTGVLISVISLLPHRKTLAQLYTSELRTYLDLPSYARDIGEVPQMSQDLKILCGILLRTGMDNKPTKRLVVIVDDLDRCEPDCIVKVFEAIKLVMDIPNVIVIISMDQRIALSALSENYQSIESYHELGCAKSIARDYLGKIINYSVCLPPLSSDSVKAYIAHLIAESEAVTSEPQPINASDREREAHVNPEVELKEPSTSQKENGREYEKGESSKSEEEASEVKVDDREIQDILADWAIMLGINNPRQIKRLYNSFHMMINIYPGERIGSKADGDYTDMALLALMLVEKINSESSSKVRLELWRYLCDGPTIQPPLLNFDPRLKKVIELFYEKFQRAEREEILTKASQFVLPYC